MDWPRPLASLPAVVPGEIERSKSRSFAAIFGDEPPPADEDSFRRFDLLAAKIKTGKNLAKLLVVADTLGVAVYITVENPTSTHNAKGLLHKLFEHFGEQVTKRLDQTAHMLNARDNEQRTALHLAVAEGSKAVVEALVGGQRGRGVRKAVRFCI